MKIKSPIKDIGSQSKEIYNHYKERGLLRYIGLNFLKIFLIYATLIILLFLTNKYWFDFDLFFHSSLDKLRDGYLLLVYYLSESTFGLIPGEILVIWTLKFDTPILYLLIIGCISYTGGITAYFIGLLILKMPRVKRLTEQKLKKYIYYARKWGGAFIVIAALFPFSPFPLVIIALALLRYPMKLYLLFAFSRILRYLIQGILFFNVMNIDNWIF